MSGPRSLRALLAGWTPRGGRDRRAQTSDDVAASAFAAAWDTAVGSDVARRSRPTRFRNGVLTVLTASPAWSDELSLHAPRIVRALQQACPNAALHKLRFMIASGRTALVLEGRRARSTGAPARTKLGQPPSDPNAAQPPHAPASGEGLEDLGATLARLASLQATLDASRDRAGWQACAACGRRFAAGAGEGAACAVCAQRLLRREQAAIERTLMHAPWLSLADVRAALPSTSAAAYESTRQRLLARWQAEIEAAQRRLRRGSVTAEDRVVAWSYVMLATGLPQHDAGRALVTDMLGRDWTRVLFGESAPSDQEAGRARRQKQKR